MSKQETRIHSEIDFDAEGKHQGFLRLPHSVHRSAYGWLPMPVISIKNGEGPCVLMMSGNHGDEYEGQISNAYIARTTEPFDIQGQLIILTMANYPAAKAGLRVSPIDQGNLNRVFPGNARGTLTQMIAHYIEEIIMPRCDVMFDLHSGGSSLLYVPSVQAHLEPDGSLHPRVRELCEAFAAPLTQVYPAADGPMSESAARRKGLIYFTTELAGAGMITPEAYGYARRGSVRVLHKLGILREKPNLPDDPPTEYVNIDGDELFCYSTEAGLFEPLVELGQTVEDGQPAAAIHTPENPWDNPTIIHFKSDGKVVCKRVPGHTERGDCLYHLGTPWKG